MNSAMRRRRAQSESFDAVNHSTVINHRHGSNISDLRPLKMTRRSSIKDLAPTPQKIAAMVQRARSKTTLKDESVRETLREDDEEEEPEPSYVSVAVLNVVLNVLSVIPYVVIIAADPSSPLFLAFCTHVFVIVVNAYKVPKMISERKIPVTYHLAFAGLAFAFTFLKGDAFSRLPTATAMVLMNLQMLVGMLIQGAVFRQTFSVPQMSGCAIVTLGVAMAGLSKQAPAASDASAASSSQLMFGTAELLGAIAAQVFLNLLIKRAFTNFGESVDEQLFVQHLLGIPMFVFGGQWDKIGPKVGEWISAGNAFLIAMLFFNLLTTFTGTKARVTFAGRAPNPLLVQLVETLTKFLQLLVGALINSPPFPPLGFWGGFGLLVAGTLQFLSSSDSAGGERDHTAQDSDDKAKDE